MNTKIFWPILVVVLLLHVGFFYWVSDKTVKVRTAKPIPRPNFYSASEIYDDPSGDGKLLVREFTVSTKLAKDPAIEPPEGVLKPENLPNFEGKDQKP